MKWTRVCPLIGVALLACATEDNGMLGGPSTGGNDSVGGTAPGAAGNNTAGASAGSFSDGGMGQAGLGTAGSFTFSGTTSFAGSFSTAGNGGASGNGASGMGGAGGMGGAAGMGGKSNGGAAGKSTGGASGAAGSGGNGGAGGGGSAQCVGITIPAKSTWKGTAFEASATDTPDKAFDGDNNTRFATGHPQDGNEWLQIDFGEIVTLNEITMYTKNNDYFRHYQLRLSNTSQDMAAPILKEADGVTGTITVPLATAKAGQYLLISQTGMVAPTWWSLYEVSVACK